MIAAVLAVTAWADPAPPTDRSVRASLVLHVSEPEDAADALVAHAERLGGWFTSRGDGTLSVSLPNGAVDAFLARAAELGTIAERRYTATDLSTELEDARTRLRAREASLELYRPLLEEANPRSVVAIERQATQLVEEIEGLEGRIRFLEHQASWAVVDLSFRFRDRRAPSREGGSPFAWLTTLNLEDLVVDFQYDAAWWRTGPARPRVPEGFSAWEGARRFRAAAPDGVLYRVRTTRRAPRADLPFWREALAERMEAAGYVVVADEEVTSQGVAGALFELRAPLGEADWTYVVAVYPVGRRLVLAEAAGEVAALEAREGALRAAMTDLGL